MSTPVICREAGSVSLLRSLAMGHRCESISYALRGLPVTVWFWWIPVEYDAFRVSQSVNSTTVCVAPTASTGRSFRGRTSSEALLSLSIKFHLFLTAGYPQAWIPNKFIYFCQCRAATFLTSSTDPGQIGLAEGNGVHDLTPSRSHLDHLMCSPLPWRHPCQLRSLPQSCA